MNNNILWLGMSTTIEMDLNIPYSTLNDYVWMIGRCNSPRVTRIRINVNPF